MIVLKSPFLSGSNPGIKREQIIDPVVPGARVGKILSSMGLGDKSSNKNSADAPSVTLQPRFARGGGTELKKSVNVWIN